MRLIETAIKGLLIIEPQIFNDGRGYFYESYSKIKFAGAGIGVDFVQDNQSFSHKGAVRGLHAQANPFAQSKLVRVIRGSVLDIAVDIRRSSPTYGKHVAVELNEENKLLLWIPAGFLHGFATLEDNTIFTYKVDNYYDKASEIGVLWNDPDLGIDWSIAQKDVLLSPKDELLPAFRSFVSPFL
jgi:dTDP-4-dehydrorhamnose 3,5-epimerase